jgi:hypothetical protein
LNPQVLDMNAMLREVAVTVDFQLKEKGAWLDHREFAGRGRGCHAGEPGIFEFDP